jgi:hypothetical protein
VLRHSLTTSLSHTHKNSTLNLEGIPMQITSSYTWVAQTRLSNRGVLAHNVRKDGRRASLTLNGLILEIGTPGRIQRRYRTPSQKSQQ